MWTYLWVSRFWLEKQPVAVCFLHIDQVGLGVFRILLFQPVFAQKAPKLVVSQAEVVCGFALMVVVEG